MPLSECQSFSYGLFPLTAFALPLAIRAFWGACKLTTEDRTGIGRGPVEEVMGGDRLDQLAGCRPARRIPVTGIRFPPPGLSARSVCDGPALTTAGDGGGWGRRVMACRLSAYASPGGRRVRDNFVP